MDHTTHGACNKGNGGVRGMRIKFANSPPCAFLHIRGIVYYKFVPTGQTVNQVHYLEVLKRPCEKLRHKRPEIFANNLHHDNAPAHVALSLKEFLATKQITVLEHPAYSPDLAPNDFFSVPQDKGHIEREAFG